MTCRVAVQPPERPQHRLSFADPDLPEGYGRCEHCRVVMDVFLWSNTSCPEPHSGAAMVERCRARQQDPPSDASTSRGLEHVQWPAAPDLPPSDRGIDGYVPLEDIPAAADVHG